ncbi:MAG: hypothetical protein M3R27_11785 [Bacteroidota bacterium]|nr:hypothetical protein [Bacteroidota bacterium]
MINYKNKSLFLLLLSVMSMSGYSQQLNYTLSRDFLWGFDNYYNNKDQKFQTFVKPYRYSDIVKINDSTAAFPRLLAGTKAEEHDKKKKKFVIEVYPLITLSSGFEASKTPVFTNEVAIGGHLLGNIGEKFSFNFKGLAGRGLFNSYVDSIIKETNVIPGMGYAYHRSNDTTGPHKTYSYQYFSGYISWSPNKIFNIQAGQDKHFWGDGYRSLFLSDVAAPYPFLKITTNVWKLSYVNLFTAMKDATQPSGLKQDRLNKYATFHYLGWNATKRINIGIFESIIWQGSDSLRHRGYDVNYLNPVMFFRPTEYSLGSSDNAFVGLSFKIKLFKKQQFYGQLLLDEFLLKEVRAQNGWWANKQAFQLGFKSFDLFGLKRLNLQTEFNYVRPYTYAHGSVQQNYGHMNQPLAHPLGANFTESVSFLNYRHKRFFFEAKFIYAVYGADSAGTDYGKNIFVSYRNRPSEYGHFTTQGFQANLITASLRAAYILDTRMNLKLELGFVERILQTSYFIKKTPYVFIGLRTDLSNLYDDF